MTETTTNISAMTDDFLTRLGCSEAVREICARCVNVYENQSICLPLTDAECDTIKDSPVIQHNLFVLNENLLYTRRNYVYEKSIIDTITAMAGKPLSEDVVIPTDGEFENLNEAQRTGIQTMCKNRFSILTGGPGTGKTYTIARAVKLYLEKNPQARIGLAAPTGKAAARIRESMRQDAEKLKLNTELTATTIHKLLGSEYNLVTFKHNRKNPLVLNWLIVDEASMIDMPLMAKLLDALPDGCRLTLVGDEHQLASVEAGRVFGDLCGMHDIAKCVLTESRRFPAGGEIAKLADMINKGERNKMLEQLKQDGEKVFYTQFDQGKMNPHDPGTWENFKELIVEKFSSFAIQTDPAEALKHLNDCRVLCADRESPFGINALNQYIRKLLGEASPIPIMIIKNNHSLKVSNGDVGVVIPDKDKDKKNILYLLDENGGVREIPMELLPETETSFASTVHKSQGSEFKDVIIVLPPQTPDRSDSNVAKLLTREILYTAVTRTQEHVYLFANDEALRLCCGQAIERNTGFSRANKQQ